MQAGSEIDLVWSRTGPIELCQMGAGDPIVLVPGLAGGWRLLEPLARELARTNRVIVPGLAGDRGGITRASGMQDHARDLAEVMGRLRLERPMVFGVSFGGAIALQLAAESPGMFGSLALYGVEASYRPGLGHTILRSVLEKHLLPVDSPFLNQFFNILHGRPPESVDQADWIVRRCWETDQGVMVRRLRALEGFDVSDHLWNIDVPTLVMAGTKDVVVAPKSQRDLAESLPDATFRTIHGAGHVGFLTHKTAVARAVRTALRLASRSAL
jgi:pimeloyl-ACP methyl ester carboxylesterase